MRRSAGADSHRAGAELQGRWLVRERLRGKGELVQQRFRFEGSKQAGREAGFKAGDKIGHKIRNEGPRSRQEQRFHDLFHACCSRRDAKVDCELIAGCAIDPNQLRF